MPRLRGRGKGKAGMSGTIKCATRADVAKRAGVSVTVVSYVMNNNRYVAQDKRERVLRAAQELNYTPNNVALALRGKNSNQILFIVDSPANERLGCLMRGMDQYAYEKGSVVTLCATRNDPEFVRQVIRRRFDGIVVSSSQLDEEYIREFVKAGIPTVLLLTHDYEDVPGTAQIGTGLYNGAKAAVKFLYAKGCRSFLYIDRFSQRNHFSDMNDCRLSGFVQACKDLDLEWRDRIITGCVSGEMIQERIGAFTREHPVDAVLGRNDRMACYAMLQFRKMGWRVPEDVKIIGVDDSSICNLVTPTLTSIHLSDDEICREAISRIYRLRAGEEITDMPYFPFQIIERESTG